MAMAGRHIRHDWQQFHPWDQKSVRTLCNKTSTWNATGIPGITEQPNTVKVKDKEYFGWCTMCSVSAFREASTILVNNPEIDGRLASMYETVRDLSRPVYDAWAARQRAARPVR